MVVELVYDETTRPTNTSIKKKFCVHIVLLVCVNGVVGGAVSVDHRSIFYLYLY